MKKLIIIPIIILSNLIGGFIAVTTLYLNGHIEVIDNKIYINNPLVSNGNLMMTDIKPYMCVDFIGKSNTIELTKDQWAQVSGYDTLFHLHHFSFGSDSAISHGGAGDYRIGVFLTIQPGITGAMDKHIDICVSVNDTIRDETIRCFAISKDNDGEITIFSQSVILLYTDSSVIKSWVMNRTDNTDITTINSQFNIQKL